MKTGKVKAFTPPMNGFGVGVELESDVFDHRTCHGDVSRPNSFFDLAFRGETAGSRKVLMKSYFHRPQVDLG